jgi:hypothetical protein
VFTSGFKEASGGFVEDVLGYVFWFFVLSGVAFAFWFTLAAVLSFL